MKTCNGIVYTNLPLAQIGFLRLEEMRGDLGAEQEGDVAGEDLDSEDAAQVRVLLLEEGDGSFHELEQAAHEGDPGAHERRQRLVASLEGEEQVPQEERHGQRSQQQHCLRSVHLHLHLHLLRHRCDLFEIAASPRGVV